MNKQASLLKTAKSAFVNAYAPYSHFKVGAAIITSDGKIYSGCNVENIAYPNGTCAETGAISAMIADGNNQIAEILIYAESSALITPCGACRQRIAEFASPDTLIHLANNQGIQKTLTIAELLPLNFKEF